MTINALKLQRFLFCFLLSALPLVAAENISKYFEEKSELVGYPPYPLALEDRSRVTEIDEIRRTYRVKAWVIPEKVTAAEVDAYTALTKKEGFNVLLTECNRNLFIDRPEQVPSHPMGSVMGPVYEDLIKNSLLASESAHRHGIKFFLHITSIMVNKNVVDEHPSWASIDMVSGKAIVNGYGTYTLCINSDEFFAEYMRRLERYFRESKADGIMLDEIQFFNEQSCGCASCAKKFKESTGFSVPSLNNIRGVNVRDGATRRWFQWRSERTKERLVELHQMLKKVNPQMIHMDYLCNSTSAWAYYAAGINLNNYVNHADSIGYEVEPPHYLNQYYTNHMIAEIKSIRAIAEKIDQQVWAFFYPRAKGDYIWNWFVAMSQGTRSWWMSHVPEREGNGPEYWQPLVAWEEKHERLISNLTSIADTALVYPRRTRDDVRLSGCLHPHMSGFMAVSNALIDAKVPYAVVLEEDLASLELLKKFKTVLLVNCAALTKGEVSGIRKFVEQGGNLVATGEASLCDVEGEKLSNFQLSELFGASFDGPAEGKCQSFEILNSAKKQGISPSSLAHPGFFVKLKEIKPETQVIGEFVTKAGRFPGLLLHAFGKGKVIYCAGHPEDGYFYSYYNENEIEKAKPWKDLRLPGYLELWKSFALLGEKAPLTVDSLPLGVVAELNHQQWGKSEGMTVHLVNFMGGLLKEGIVSDDQPISFPEILKALPASAKKIQVEVRLDKPSRCFLFSPDFDGVVELPVKRAGGFSKVEVSEVYRYLILYFSTGEMAEIDRISKGKYLSAIPKAKELVYKKIKPLGGAYNPNAIYLFSNSDRFSGGKLDANDQYSFGRYIYGKESGALSTMTGRFTNTQELKSPTLEIMGMDDNRETKVVIKIQVNQKVVFSGPSAFPDNAWGKQQFEIPDHLLKRGENEITITVLGSGFYGGPPWFGLNHFKVSEKGKAK